jgi:hypothetical protein
MSSDTLATQLTKPAAAFAFGAALVAWSHPNLLVELMGKDVPAWAIGGAAAAGCTALGTIYNAKASPHVSVITPLNAPMNSAANIALIAAGTALTYSTIVGAGWSNTIGLPEVLVGSAIIEVGSSYTSEMWLKPFLASNMY